jgi:hypothetical protein
MVETISRVLLWIADEGRVGGRGVNEIRNRRRGEREGSGPNITVLIVARGRSTTALAPFWMVLMEEAPVQVWLKIVQPRKR